MSLDKTIRGNGRWARVSGQRGKWFVAQGFKGELSVPAIRCNTTGTQSLALTIARYWIADGKAAA